VTRYLSITPLQEPFDGKLDAAGRETRSFNVLAMKRPSDTWVQELVTILEEAGLGERGETIFASSNSTIPAEGDGPFIYIESTGGAGPVGTHNDGVGAYRRPSARIVVHARLQVVAEATAQAVYAALLAVRNKNVVAA
jgi:hypothetical protein